MKNFVKRDIITIVSLAALFGARGPVPPSQIRLRMYVSCGV